MFLHLFISDLMWESDYIVLVSLNVDTTNNISSGALGVIQVLRHAFSGNWIPPTGPTHSLVTLVMGHSSVT